MALTVSEKDLGTSEEAWATCRYLRALPAFEWPVASSRGARAASAGDAGGHVVVVAPHPDDETLGVGGLLAQLAREGVRVTVLAVTDGEASHPKSTTTRPHALADRRRREQAAALEALGSTARVVRLQVPDGRVHEQTDLARQITAHVEGAAMCVAPYREDGHPDHDAAGEAAATACARRGVRLVEYPVWAWHWARPNSDGLPWGRARRIALGPDDVDAKARAIRAYASQIEPLSSARGDEAIVPRKVLERFHRPFEVVFV